MDSALDLHAGADSLDDTSRVLLPGLDLSDPTETAFTTEYFAPVLGVAELPGSGGEFLDAAVTAANERLRGTLGANIIIHPSTARALGDGLRDRLARLRYGTIGVNAWTGVGYLTATATGEPSRGILSTTSRVASESSTTPCCWSARSAPSCTDPFRPSPRSVLHGERSISPKPPWFVDNRTAATTGRRITEFAARPRWRALPAIFASALRG